MDTIDITDSIHIPAAELNFRFSRSGGPGGQNVNKVSTRVELTFDLDRSSLEPKTKSLLRAMLAHRIDSSGVLSIVSQESRSQWKNRQSAVEKFIALLKRALRPVKHRTPTSATKTSREKRLAGKKGRGEIKKLRRINVAKEID